MTPEQFKAAVGREHRQDDLERANCDKAGQHGHTNCGVCEHQLPVFCCQECFVRSSGQGEPVKYQLQAEGPNDY